jgi:hypothetical protein
LFRKNFREDNRFTSFLFWTDVWLARSKSDEWTKEFISDWRSHEFDTRYRSVIKREEKHDVGLFKCERSIRLRLNKAVVKRHEKASFISSNSQMSRRIYERSINWINIQRKKAEQKTNSNLNISRIINFIDSLFNLQTIFIR